MKVSSLIELLNSCDPEAYIQLEVRGDVYTFAVERQYPGDEFNKNLIIRVPDIALGLNKNELEQFGVFGESDIVESNDIEIIDEEV